MSIPKIIIIVILLGIGLFIALLVYTLSPTIKDVSNKNILKDLVGRPLMLKRDAAIYFCKPGDYRFLEQVLSDSKPFTGEVKFILPAGARIVIQKFKTYKSNAGSGFTDLYAVGEYLAPNEQKIEFEYCWGGTDPSFYSHESAVLPSALWQDENNVLIKYEAN